MINSFPFLFRNIEAINFYAGLDGVPVEFFLGRLLRSWLPGLEPMLTSVGNLAAAIFFVRRLLSGRRENSHLSCIDICRPMHDIHYPLGDC